MNTTVKITPAQVFPVANKIRAEKKISMKEAYALAKAQLMSEATNMVETPANMVTLHNELSEKMLKGNVKFSFKNAKGKVITTTGTLQMEKVPTNRVVQGRKVAKDENTQVFYDVRHGVYRSYQKNMVVSIL